MYIEKEKILSDFLWCVKLSLVKVVDAARAHFARRHVYRAGVYTKSYVCAS